MYSALRDADVSTSREHAATACELDGGLAERAGVEVQDASSGSVLVELGVLAVGLELAESACRFEAALSPREVAGIRAEKLYVDKVMVV